MYQCCTHSAEATMKSSVDSPEIAANCPLNTSHDHVFGQLSANAARILRTACSSWNVGATYYVLIGLRFPQHLYVKHLWISIKHHHIINLIIISEMGASIKRNYVQRDFCSYVCILKKNLHFNNNINVWTKLETLIKGFCATLHATSTNLRLDMQ